MCRPKKIVQLKKFIYMLKKTVLDLDVQGVERQPLLEGLQAGCCDDILWQLVPYMYTDCAREEGV